MALSSILTIVHKLHRVAKNPHIIIINHPKIDYRCVTKLLRCNLIGAIALIPLKTQERKTK